MSITFVRLACFAPNFTGVSIFYSFEVVGRGSETQFQAR